MENALEHKVEDSGAGMEGREKQFPRFARDDCFAALQN
jgi:hypothetical protein